MSKRRNAPRKILSIEDIDKRGVIGPDYPKAGTPDQRQIYWCKKWLELHVEPYPNKDSWNLRISSNNYKHAVERWLGDKLRAEEGAKEGNYITNGAFIVAALEMGFKARPACGYPDAYFNFRPNVRKSDRAAWRNAGFRQW